MTQSNPTLNRAPLRAPALVALAPGAADFEYVDGTIYGSISAPSGSHVELADNSELRFGDADDLVAKWDGTSLKVTQAAPNSAIQLGVDGAGIDLILMGDTAGATLTWDQSADAQVYAGVAGTQGAVVKTNGATSITTTRAVTRADSGGAFAVTLAAGAYTITIAGPLAANERYIFALAAGAGAGADVSIVATGCTFIGSITIDAATIVATGSTMKFTTAAGVVGDWIEVIALSTTIFLVRAIASTAGGITVT